MPRPLGTSLDYRPKNIASLKSTIKTNTSLNSVNNSNSRRVNLRQTMKKQELNWKSQSKSRKKLQKEYNRIRKKLDPDKRLFNPSLWFTPRVLSQKNISQNFRPKIANTNFTKLSKKKYNQLSKRNYPNALYLYRGDSEYEKILRVKKNLKEFMKTQSKVLEKMDVDLKLSYHKVYSSETTMKEEKNRNIEDMFGSIANYEAIRSNVDRGITKQDASNLTEYYRVMKDSVNNYLLDFNHYICCKIEFVISVLVWGFCLPHNSLTNPDYILRLSNMIDKHIVLLRVNIFECTRRYQHDPDFEPYNLEKVERLYGILKSLIGLKLVNEDIWHGDYITEDEIFTRCIITIPSIFLIDELDEYLRTKTYKFPYNQLSPLETEIINSLLLLKIKQKQPGTIHVPDFMVTAPGFWTQAQPVQLIY